MALNAWQSGIVEAPPANTPNMSHAFEAEHRAVRERDWTGEGAHLKSQHHGLNSEWKFRTWRDTIR
jgi:hypothetical protein